jgi:hypothetical protein
VKYAESDYIAYDPFEGDEADIRCRTVKLVKVRKEQQCFIGAAPLGDNHVISRGDVARFEKALVDGDFWGKSYVCIPCMDKWLDEVIGEGDDK